MTVEQDVPEIALLSWELYEVLNTELPDANALYAVAGFGLFVHVHYVVIAWVSLHDSVVYCLRVSNTALHKKRANRDAPVMALHDNQIHLLGIDHEKVDGIDLVSRIEIGQGDSGYVNGAMRLVELLQRSDPRVLIADKERHLLRPLGRDRLIKKVQPWLIAGLLELLCVSRVSVEPVCFPAERGKSSC